MFSKALLTLHKRKLEFPWQSSESLPRVQTVSLSLAFSRESSYIPLRNSSSVPFPRDRPTAFPGDTGTVLQGIGSGTFLICLPRVSITYSSPNHRDRDHIPKMWLPRDCVDSKLRMLVSDVSWPSEHNGLGRCFLWQNCYSTICKCHRSTTKAQTTRMYLFLQWNQILKTKKQEVLILQSACKLISFLISFTAIPQLCWCLCNSSCRQHRTGRKKSKGMGFD